MFCWWFAYASLTNLKTLKTSLNYILIKLLLNFIRLSSKVKLHKTCKYKNKIIYTLLVIKELLQFVYTISNKWENCEKIIIWKLLK